MDIWFIVGILLAVAILGIAAIIKAIKEERKAK